MTKDVLPEYHQDLDYLIGMLDWDANVNPSSARAIKLLPEAGETVRRKWKSEGYRELWITYGTALLLGEGADRAAEAAP